MNLKKIAAILFVIVGIVSICLACSAYDMSTGNYEYNESYGGDAYTGIQNAAAQGANNTIKVAEAIAFASGSVLLVAGFAMIVVGINTWPAADVDIAQLMARFKAAPVEQTEEGAAPEAVAEEKIACPNCGSSQEKNAGFCGSCGTKLQ